MSQPGDVLGGRYRLLERLGSGAAGTVFRALDENLDVERAVKVLTAGGESSEQSLSRFQREARTLVKLDHPNLVRVVDAHPGADGGYIVMELVDGPDLARLVNDGGPLPADRAVRIVLEVLDALDAVHAAGLVHRDVKPHNVLVGSDGRARLTDFGIAHVTGQTGLLTAAGAKLGTWEFAAPEQFDDARSADARADLFGAGMLLVCLITGRALLEAWRLDARDLASAGLPDVLAEFVVRATRRLPDHRYASAVEMREALAAASQRLDATAAPAAPAVARGTVPNSLTMTDFFTRRADDLPPGQRSRLRIVRLGVAAAVAGLALWLVPGGDQAEFPVRIDSRPVAELTVDGIGRGPTPWEGRLRSGPHTVVFTSADGTPHPTRMEVAEQGSTLCWDLETDGPCAP